MYQFSVTAAKVKLIAKRSDGEDQKMDIEDEDDGECPNISRCRWLILHHLLRQSCPWPSHMLCKVGALD